VLPAFCLLLAVGLAGPACAQDDEGQYRSKVRIEPGGISTRDTGLSIEELEQQIASISDSYARSSAGRHLARHYVEQGDYTKAIEYYQTALAADGLADVANREMLRELAQVYLLNKNYAAAANALERALRIKLVPQAGDYLLLAQAYYHLGNLSRVVGALDPIREQGLALSNAQKRQALALYYQAGAYARCEELLQQLLESEPDDAANWHQLASVYLQQGKQRKALDQLTLAWEKSVPFREQDTILLADLHAVNGDPYGAAEILQEALGNRTVEANGLHYRKLFQFWLTARENERATAALVQAARLTGDIELYLYLAQLQMEQEAWPDMYQTMVGACKNQLQDKYVSRANLLLGISQLKLGDRESARRAFINATLVGGASKQAGDWLGFMGAEPATKAEGRRVVGVCYGSRGKQVSAAAMADTSGQDGAAEAAQAETVAVRTVPRQALFYIEYDKSLAELAADARSLAMRMSVALIKSGGKIDGPLQLISTGMAGDNPLQLAFPTAGAPRAGKQYKIRQAAEFKCAYLVHEGDMGALGDRWRDFVATVTEAGYELTGESRTVFAPGGAGVELQLGIE
jgi:tetratricopeptide (TPR) repeat protein